MVNMFKINGNSIRDPSSFNISHRKIEVKRRLASGKLVVDVISVKEVITLTYSYLEDFEAEYWRNLFISNEFFDFTYVLNGVEYTRNVWLSDLPLDLLNMSQEFWGSTTIEMEER